MEDNFEVEIEPEGEPADPMEESNHPEQKPAAFTLVIQSWATPIIGVVMLIVGLFGGYYLRPIFSPAAVSEATKAVEDNTTSDTVSAAGNATATVPMSDEERVAQQQKLMTAVVDRTRHFLGDPNAPVTLIEFSDFQ
jgi:protein-disulfide isomerase